MHDGSPSRRDVLKTGVLVAGALAGCNGADGDGTPTDATDGGTASATPDSETPTERASLDDLELRAEPIADGFTAPLATATPGPGEILVADQMGLVHRVVDGEVSEEPFLDVRDFIVDVSGYSERGLLGIALHPEYADNGRVFVRYSSPPRANTPSNYAHTFVLSEFQADPEAGVADENSEEILLTIPQPQANHNGGPIAFGPDGYLYVTVGDGGRANDQGEGHVDDWYDAVGGGNGQDVEENLLGSLLRIDVDGNDGGRAYGIPDDNPLVGEDGLDEHYAWGLRNPFGVAWGPDGRGFVVDVGQNRFEEVNVLQRGANYGWNVREGMECFQAESCPSETPSGEELVDPIVAYPHEGAEVSGVAVLGGPVYTGDAISRLQGRYVFGDWQANGRIFVATEGPDGWSAEAVQVEGALGSSLLGIGTDANGEILLASSNEGGVTGETGMVARLGPA